VAGAIDLGAATGRIYVICTSVPAEEMNATRVIKIYTSLSEVEENFRSMKAATLVFTSSITGARIR